MKKTLIGLAALAAAWAVQAAETAAQPAPAAAAPTAMTPAQFDEAMSRLPKPDLAKGRDAHAKRMCGGCHGAEGLSSGNPAWPDIAGQPAAVTVKALLDYKEGRRKGAMPAQMMSGAAAPLTMEDISNLAAFYATLPGRNAKPYGSYKISSMPQLVKKGDPVRGLPRRHGARQPQRRGAGAARPAEPGPGGCPEGLPQRRTLLGHPGRDAGLCQAAHRQGD